MITNYASLLYDRFDKEYKRNGTVQENSDEKRGFLQKPVPSVGADKSMSPSDISLEMFTTLRQAREKLKVEKGM